MASYTKLTEVLRTGPWQARAISYVHGYSPSSDLDGRIAVRDDRTGQTWKATLYRFPAGWRCSTINEWPVPETAKRLARKAMNQLP